MAAQSNATQLFQSGTPSGITNVVRDANGMLTKWVENGFAMSVAWSSAGFPLQLVAAGPRGRLVQTYTFDANGRLAGLSGDNIPTEFSQELLLGVPATLASAGQVGALRSLVSGAGILSSSRAAISTDSGAMLELSAGVTYTLTDAVSLPAGVVLMGPASGSATIACTGSATINGGTSAVTVAAGAVYSAIPRATSAAAFVVKGS